MDGPTQLKTFTRAFRIQAVPNVVRTYIQLVVNDKPWPEKKKVALKLMAMSNTPAPSQYFAVFNKF